MIPALAGKVKSSFDALLQTDLVEILARQTKFVQRASKLNGEKFTAMMVFADGSLADTSLLELSEDFWYNNTEKIPTF